MVLTFCAQVARPSTQSGTNPGKASCYLTMQRPAASIYSSHKCDCQHLYLQLGIMGWKDGEQRWQDPEVIWVNISQYKYMFLFLWLLLESLTWISLTWIPEESSNISSNWTIKMAQKPLPSSLLNILYPHRDLQVSKAGNRSWIGHQFITRAPPLKGN